MLYSIIKKNGKKVSDLYARDGNYFYLSPAGLILKRRIEGFLEKYASGDLLDAGAGRLAYKRLLQAHCSGYRSIDIEPRSDEIDFVGDLQALAFGDSTFDTVFCSQVLEHLPEPWKAMVEFRRVLRPGGALILSAPHISYLHNEPGDYYRFTAHGLKHMLERAGFKVVEMAPAGGAVAFLGHILSTAAIGMIYEFQPLWKVFFQLNKLFSRIALLLDRVFNTEKILPLNYVAAAVRVD